jgi:hypothetical protein
LRRIASPSIASTPLTISEAKRKGEESSHSLRKRCDVIILFERALTFELFKEPASTSDKVYPVNYKNKYRSFPEFKYGKTKIEDKLNIRNKVIKHISKHEHC